MLFLYICRNQKLPADGNTMIGDKSYHGDGVFTGKKWVKKTSHLR